MSGAPLRIAVAGAGAIGRRHVESVIEVEEATLSAIVDPAPEAKAYAEGLGAPWFESLETLFAVDKPDGVVLATPNLLHVEHGLSCVAANCPMLLEKPVATDAAAAERLVSAAEAAGLPMLVGHHRRHNPLMKTARETVASGALGTILSVNAMFWLVKPDAYFEVPWRRREGGGPIFMNLIHDVDLLRWLVGEIVSVQAWSSNAVRGHPIEDVAVAMLRFANGALGTATISDAVTAPWSWEQTSQEDRQFPSTGEACYRIGGTHGSLELPNPTLWRTPSGRGWREPIETLAIATERGGSLSHQVRNFCAVIRGEAEPVVSGREGLRTLRVIEAVKRSAAAGGARVDLPAEG